MRTEDLYVFRLIGGCKDQRLRRNLLKLKDPTLEDILQEGEAFDVANRSIRDHEKAKPSTSVSSAKTITMDSLKGRCFGCGGDRHKDRSSCKAQGTTCTTCGKKNHYARVCFGGAKSKSSTQPTNKGTSNVKAIESNKNNSSDTPTVPTTETCASVVCALINQPDRIPPLQFQFTLQDGREFQILGYTRHGHLQNCVSTPVGQRYECLEFNLERSFEQNECCQWLSHEVHWHTWCPSW